MIKKIFGAVLIVLVVLACSKSDDNDSGSGTNDTFDRTALLTNIADNIIIPAYQDLNADLNVLVESKDAFIASPGQTTLEALRTDWFTAYKTLQAVQMFEIGKAEEIFYKKRMNVYPTNVTLIENNISDGGYDLSNGINNAAVGFPAVDYMLYGVGTTDDAILTIYSNSNYRQYLSDLIDEMQALTTTVLTDWTSNYRNAFIANTESSITGSFDKLLNDYVFYYERELRAQKIGIPAGVFSATPEPSKVEALYKQDNSKELVLLALDAVQDLFNGKHHNSNSEGESIKTYLIALNRNDLVEVINNRLNNAIETVANLDTNLKNQVETDNTKMTQAYDAIQLAVVSLKSDMLSALNVNYNPSEIDNDGD